ncbi:MAG TPA: CvpA family protein [Candidatus Omnitrophota bacterium]|nr:CvpA family protein [Candidatus Omnitrophota bacterium]
MLTITDYIVLIVVGLSTLNGWRRGFLRSILGPLALILCSFFSLIYFQITHNLFLTLLFGILGPILLNILFALLLGSGKKTTPENQSISSISRILGALFNFSWNTGLLILFLVWILIIPANVFGLAKIHSDINRSLTISLLNKLLPDRLPMVERFQNTWNVLNDPKKRGAIESSLEYKAIAQDQKIQNILADQNLIEQIRRGEIAKVLSNPKIREISQDKELIKKFLDLESSILRKESPKNLKK